MADLLDVATVARYLGLTDYTDDYDDIDRLIDAAQDAIEAVTNRTLSTATTYTEWHDAGDTYIYVDRPPIVSISALYDDAQNSARSISSVDWIDSNDDQGKNYRAGKIELWNHEGGFGGGRLDAKVTYVGGWTSSTIPQDLRQAWIELVCFWHNTPDRAGVLNQSAGGQTATYDPDHIPASLMRVFRRYTLARNW